MRIRTSIETQLFMDRIKTSNTKKAKESSIKNLEDTITLSNSAKKVSKAIKRNGASSNRKIDGSINLQSYINKAKEKNTETIKNSGDKIIAQNSYASEGDACYQALKDKYAKLLQEAKSHSNPNAYIQDKYCNENSPHYVSDLTDEERDVAYSNEVNLLNYGQINGCDMRDSLFRGISINGVDEVENRKTFSRQVVNSEMDNLFRKNGIELSQGTKLAFSIDPYSYNLTISGTEDEGLKEKIEELLNSGNNLKELYSHILSSSSGSDVTKSTQFTRDGLLKRNLYHEALEVTGIDIRSLTEKAGSYYTDDGQNITDIFNTELEEMAKNGKSYVPKKFIGACEETFASMIQEVASKGWNNMPDMMLSIEYSDNKLQDVSQNTNYSECYQYTTYRYGKNSFNTLP